MAKKSKGAFKREWNSFSVLTTELLENVLNETINGEAEIDIYNRELENIESNEERIKFILTDKKLKAPIENHIDEQVKKLVPLEIDGLKFAKERLDANESILDKDSALSLVNYYTQGISVLYFNPDLDQEGKTVLSMLFVRRAQAFLRLGYLAEYNQDLLEARKLKESSREGGDLNKEEVSEGYGSSEPVSDFMPREWDIPKEVTGVEVEQGKEIAVKEGAENTLLECASKHLKMAIDPYKGRYYECTEPAEIGTVLVVEEAYAAWLRSSLYTTYCYACLQKLGPRYWNCRNCFKVRFCSSDCANKAWDSFHKSECGCLDVLKDWAMAHLALRTVLNEGIDNAFKVAAETPISSEEWSKIGFKRDYRCIYSLTGEDSLKGTMYFLSCLLGGALMATFAAKVGLIPANDETKLYLFGSILYKHLAQVLINTFLLYDYNMYDWDAIPNLKLTSVKRKKVGVGLYATSSLFSHSCDNNVAKYYDKNRIVLTNWRRIEKGEEVTVNYGASCYQSTLKDRSSFLYGNFGFECKCSACAKSLECMAYAYQCPICSGALVINEDKSNYCFSCEAQGLDVSAIEETIEEARKDLIIARRYMVDKNLDKAKACLLMAKRRHNACYFSLARQCQLNYLFSEYYELKEKFWKAYKFCRASLSTQKEIYGPSSVEVLNLLVRLYQLTEKVTTENPIYKYRAKRKAQNLSKECQKILTMILDRELNITSEEHVYYLRSVL